MTDNNTYKGTLEVLRKRVEDIRDELDEVLGEIDRILEFADLKSADPESSYSDNTYYYQFQNSEDLYEYDILDNSGSETFYNYVKRLKTDENE